MSNTVAMDFGRTIWGPVGGSIFAFMVAFSCFGALNGMLDPGQYLGQYINQCYPKARFIPILVSYTPQGGKDISLPYLGACIQHEKPLLMQRYSRLLSQSFL